MHRYELTDQQWARIEPHLPHRTHHGNLGHPFNDHRPILNGILWILHTGAPWRDLPERYGPWETVYYRFNRWRRDGTWIRIVSSLLDELDDRGQIDHDLWCIDGSVIRASRAAAGAKKKASQWCRLGGRQETQMEEPPDHALGRSRGGFGTKIHLVCDSHGSVVGIHVTAGQRHDSVAFEPTMARRLFRRRRGQRRWPRRLAGDKGYSYRRIRRWCRRRRVEAVIPTRKDQPRDEKFDKATYKRRNIIERVVGWFKEYRRLGTRYEKLAVNYVAMWLVAIMEKALFRLLPNTA
ncbi:IS5 family transposase [Singulisphaera acidiphila]|uniref:Transposase n=6 Tax=Singulisphaera acidiphila TaxID=466153 RepID=L0DFA1_SINAD|nr:IS5 family transposase [Singulisphaera acidiphila]AGA27927.1 transposase [Singulisphaera acidiphila DSM 18658]AGA29363.1 transposase [Singulisphaera acidiphila DSM 18658]